MLDRGDLPFVAVGSTRPHQAARLRPVCRAGLRRPARWSATERLGDGHIRIPSCRARPAADAALAPARKRPPRRWIRGRLAETRSAGPSGYERSLNVVMLPERQRLPRLATLGRLQKSCRLARACRPRSASGLEPAISCVKGRGETLWLGVRWGLSAYLRGIWNG
jgi:hypothetical protein